MVFSSSSFLFMFFPLCLAAYFLLKNRPYRNAVLLLFSLFFYAWGGGLGFLLLWCQILDADIRNDNRNYRQRQAVGFLMISITGAY